MNDYDSARLSDLLADEEGYERTENLEEADLVVINTCSIREKAQEKVFSDLGRIREVKKLHPDMRIAVGDCVVSAEGYLVGVISEVGLNWSTVLTVIDTDTELGARIFRTGEVAVAEGDFSLMGQGKLKLSYLTSDDEVLIGDQIVTSGLGGYYPSGLVIGSVESLQTGDDGLARYAVLAPMMDFDALTEVFVITDYDIVD